MMKIKYQLSASFGDFDGIDEYDFKEATTSEFIENSHKLVLDGDKTNAITISVTTPVVSVVREDNDITEGEDRYSDDTFTTTFESGMDVLNAISGPVLVITDKEDNTIKYIVRLDDSTSSNEKMAAKLENNSINELDKLGERDIDLSVSKVIDGDTENEEFTATFVQKDNESVNIDSYKNGVFVFSLKGEKSEDESKLQKIKFHDGLTIGQIRALANKTSDYIVEDIKDNFVKFYTGSEYAFKLGNQATDEQKTKYEDYLFVKISVTPDEDEDDFVNSVQYTTYENVINDSSFFDKKSVVIEQNDVMYVVSGFKFDEKNIADPVATDTLVFTIDDKEEKNTIVSGDSTVAYAWTWDVDTNASISVAIDGANKDPNLVPSETGSITYVVNSGDVAKVTDKNGTLELSDVRKNGDITVEATYTPVSPKDISEEFTCTLTITVSGYTRPLESEYTTALETFGDELENLGDLKSEGGFVKTDSKNYTVTFAQATDPKDKYATIKEAITKLIGAAKDVTVSYKWGEGNDETDLDTLLGADGATLTSDVTDETGKTLTITIKNAIDNAGTVSDVVITVKFAKEVAI